MTYDRRKSRFLNNCCIGLSALAMAQFCLSPVLAAEAFNPFFPGEGLFGPFLPIQGFDPFFPGQGLGHGGSSTATPIKHVIVIIGENRSFDHVFATYVPKHGESVNNLLSQGIVKLDANKNAIPDPTSKRRISSPRRISVRATRFC